MDIQRLIDCHCPLRDRALFDLAIDSKLRACDLVKVPIRDLVCGGRIRQRAIVIRQKTGKPVQFELLEPARTSLLEWLERRGGSLDDFVFSSRTDHSDHISTRQHARLVDEWVTAIGLRREDYGTHSIRRTKAALVYQRGERGDEDLRRRSVSNRRSHCNRGDGRKFEGNSGAQGRSNALRPLRIVPLAR